MLRRSVTRRTYHAANIIFHSLCLSGLIWQVTQISTNFFRFDVIRDIKVIMPEQINNSGIALNICFENSQVVTEDAVMAAGNIYEVNREELIIKMSANQRFNSTPGSGPLFPSSNEVERFLFGTKFCYQVKNVTNVVAEGHLLGKVKATSLSRGEKLPSFDHNRLVTVILDLVRSNSRFDVKYHVHSFNRLKWPYTDNCADYIVSQIQAIVHCINLISLNKTNTLYQYKVVRSKSRHIDRVIDTAEVEEHERICTNKFPQLDCIQNVYLTSSTAKSETTKVWLGKIKFFTGDDSDPSYWIQSKPRIDNIDFVTYILGSLGAWIGFSFIVINPVPYFLHVEETRDKHGSKDELRFTKLKNELFIQCIMLRNVEKRTADAFTEQKTRADRCEMLVTSLVQDIQKLNRNFTALKQQNCPQ